MHSWRVDNYGFFRYVSMNLKTAVCGEVQIIFKMSFGTYIYIGALSAKRESENKEVRHEEVRRSSHEHARFHVVIGGRRMDG